MRIFEVDDGNDKIWILAENEDEAFEVYMSEYSTNEPESVVISEVSQVKWASMYVLNINEHEPFEDEVEYDENDYINGCKIECTFKEFAEKTEVSCIIASS